MMRLKIIESLRVFTTIMFVSVLVSSCNAPDETSGPKVVKEKTGAQAFEKIPKGEAKQISKIATLTTALQDQRTVLPEQLGKVLRGVHPKSHGCVEAEFVINNDINKKYQVGLFKKPGDTFKAQIRFSNASVKIAPDLEGGKNGSRGMAIKIYNVKGKFLDSDSGRHNQDFLMINTPEFAFSDVRGYAYLTDALHASPHGNNADQLFALVIIQATINGTPTPPFPEPTQEGLKKLKMHLASKGQQLPKGFSLQDIRDLTNTLNILLTKIQTKTVRNPMQVQYFGAAPFLFGKNQVMKFSVAPTILVEQEKFNLPSATPNQDYLREALSKVLQNDSVEFDFKIQVRNKNDDFGKKQVLIENATTTWEKGGRSELDGYINVAKIKVKAGQNPNTEKSKAECEKLAFSPWHSLAAHQPIGGINRLRQDVYNNSASHRSNK